MNRRAWVIIVAGLACGPAPARGQTGGGEGASARGSVRRARPDAVVPPAVAPLLSAIVPGSGQLALRQDRFVLYGVIEGLTWLKFAKDSREQREQERRYRDLARQVARAHFSVSMPRPPDGDWDYYESMEKWFESGAFSLSPTELVPETDPTTLNGNRWDLAQRNNGVDPAAPIKGSPEYQAALNEYSARAVRAEFQWSWRNAQLEWDLYRRTIDKRNDAAHSVGLDFSILLANHVLSAVDAFVAYRLTVHPAAGGGASLTGSIPFDALKGAARKR